MTDVLIVYGGWPKHEPKPTTDLVAGLLRDSGCTVTLSDTLNTFLDVEHLQAFDVIVPNWSLDTITGEQAAGLRQAVESGVGLAGWHGAAATFKDNADYQFMIGGQFVAHPGGVIDYDVMITQPAHPIMAGLENFSVHSEQYYMHVDPLNNVLATTTFDGSRLPWIEGCEMPVAWTRQWGAGRVFYCSLGHVAAEFEVTPMREIVRRGILWAAGALV